MANEISNEISSQFYTCITQDINKNENIPKRYSLPTKLSSFDSASCVTAQDNKKIDNKNDFINDDNNVNSMNQKECSELIIETQQKLENLRLESFIRTFPFNSFSQEERHKKNVNMNYTEVFNTIGKKKILKKL